MIILLTDQEPLIFPNEAEALDYVEATDVKNGEYEAFDEDGQRLNIQVEYVPRKRKLFGLGLPIPHVTISRREANPEGEMVCREDEREYLTRRLRTFISEHGTEKVTASTPLATLIKICDDMGY